MLAALPMYLNREVVQIYVFFRKGKRLGDPQSCIKEKAHQRVKPSLTRTCFIGHHAPDCRGRKRRQNFLLLLELRYGDEILPVLFMKPPEVGVDATEVAVDGDGRDVPLPEFYDALPDGFLGFERTFKRLEGTAVPNNCFGADGLEILPFPDEILRHLNLLEAKAQRQHSWVMGFT